MSIGMPHLNSFILKAFGTGVIFCCASALVIMTSFMGCVHQESTKYLRYLKRNKVPDKMSMKVLRSIKIESVECGSFYEVRKITSLTLLGMITNISGSLLISLKTAW